MVIDADTGQRQLIWAELDSQASTNADRNLFIRPGKNFREGHRYIVALRNLKRADGSPIEPQRPFRVYRDGILTTSSTVEARRAHMESLFAALGRAGIERRDLYLAWDFTVASAKRIAGRLLGMRDKAFADLGDTKLADLTVQGDAPAVHARAPVRDHRHRGRRAPARVRAVHGAVLPRHARLPARLPLRLRRREEQRPGADPRQHDARQLRVHRPRRDSTGARPSLYGHGLLGDASEVDLPPQRSMVKDHDFIYCATDWKGMSQEDVPNVAAILNDLSGFPSLTDRMQQGILNFLYLGRLMIHPDGLPSDPALAGKIDTRRLFYDGNSQGGIYGGTVTAVSPDVRRSVLGVPAMNYSTLLQRSTDFSQYAAVMNASYPDELERPLLFSLIQQLWDRSARTATRST